MLRNKQYERLLLLIRQFGVLLEKGKSGEHALHVIESALPDKTNPELTILKQLVTPGTGNVGFPVAIGPVRTLGDLMAYCVKAGGDKIKLFRGAYEKLLRYDQAQHINNFDTSSLLGYLIALLLMASLVTGIYAIFVFPGFEELFYETDAELPLFTSIVMTTMSDFGLLIILSVMSILGFLFYVVAKTRSNIQQLRFFGAPFTWLPGLRVISTSYNDYLSLNFLHVLMQAGVAEQVALDFIRGRLQAASANTSISAFGARQITGSVDALGFARSLGNLVEEVEHQIHNRREAAIEQYTWFKESMGTVAMVTVAVIIGILIVAMYLPVFQLGKIVGG